MLVSTVFFCSFFSNSPQNSCLGSDVCGCHIRFPLSNVAFFIAFEESAFFFESLTFRQSVTYLIRIYEVTFFSSGLLSYLSTTLVLEPCTLIKRKSHGEQYFRYIPTLVLLRSNVYHKFSVQKSPSSKFYIKARIDRKC